MAKMNTDIEDGDHDLQLKYLQKKANQKPPKPTKQPKTKNPPHSEIHKHLNPKEQTCVQI